MSKSVGGPLCIFKLRYTTRTSYLLLTVSQLAVFTHSHWLLLDVILREQTRLASHYLRDRSWDHHVLDGVVGLPRLPSLWRNHLKKSLKFCVLQKIWGQTFMFIKVCKYTGHLVRLRRQLLSPLPGRLGELLDSPCRQCIWQNLGILLQWAGRSWSCSWGFWRQVAFVEALKGVTRYLESGTELHLGLQVEVGALVWCQSLSLLLFQGL